MKLLIVLLVLLIACSPTSIAAGIRFDSAPDPIVTKLARSVEGTRRDLPCDSAAARLCRMLVDAGYLKAVVSCDTSGAPRVTAGTRHIIGRITTTGDTVIRAEVNSPMTSESVDTAIGRLVTGLQDKGYYYAQATIVAVDAHADTVNLIATLRRGPLVTIADVLCEGLVRNSTATVRRYLQIESGALVTGTTLAAVETRARQIPFLSYEPPIAVIPRPGYNQADIKMRFREPSAVSLQGNAGYGPNDRSGLIWSFDGAVRDVLGDGRRIRLRSERRDKNHTSLGVDYRQPVFWFGRSELEAGLHTRDYRDQFSEFTVSAGLSSRVGDRTILGSTIEWSRIDPVAGLVGYTKYLARLNFSLSSAGDTINPISGNTVSWSASYVYRRYRPTVDSAGNRPTAVNETRSQLTVGRIQPLGSKKLVGAASANFLLFLSPEQRPPLAELYLLGGPGTIRGYRTDQFSATRAAIGTAELRWRGSAGYSFAFCDLAYIAQPVTGNLLDEFTRVGYGVGFNLIDRDRAIMLAFAWNPDLEFTRPQLLLQVATGL